MSDQNTPAVERQTTSTTETAGSGAVAVAVTVAQQQRGPLCQLGISSHSARTCAGRVVPAESFRTPGQDAKLFAMSVLIGAGKFSADHRWEDFVGLNARAVVPQDPSGGSSFAFRPTSSRRRDCHRVSQADSHRAYRADSVSGLCKISKMPADH